MRDDTTASWDDDTFTWECLWCHTLMQERKDEPLPHYPYCSSECAIDAEGDSMDEDLESAW